VIVGLVGGYLVYEHSFAASKTEFTSGLSGLCLEDENGATTNGNPVTVGACKGWDRQQYTISGKTVMAKGLCMEVQDDSTANGAVVDMSVCNGSPGQNWSYASHTLMSARTGKCLTATKAGAQLAIQPCNGSTRQKWTKSASGYVAPTPSAAPAASSAPSGGSGGGTSPCSTYTPTSTSAGCGFPSAATTGPAANTSLKIVASIACSYTIKTANAVVDGITTGCIDVEANNVTIENSVIKSDTWWGIHTTNGVTGLKLVHDTIGNQGAGQGPDSGGYDYAITGFRTLDVSYCNISGFKDGVDISDGTFDNNYVHDLSEFSGAHTQDVYVYPATTTLTINHNTLINQTPIQYSTAAVYIAPDSPGQNHDTITDNWMAGGSYTFYGGDSSAKYIVVKNNIFSTEISPSGGTYGVSAGSYWHADNVGNIWSGNVWGNGPNAGKTISP
jgi:Ricin-type beta-trefoil lectin domain